MWPCPANPALMRRWLMSCHVQSHQCSRCSWGQHVEVAYSQGGAWWRQGQLPRHAGDGHRLICWCNKRATWPAAWSPVWIAASVFILWTPKLTHNKPQTPIWDLFTQRYCLDDFLVKVCVLVVEKQQLQSLQVSQKMDINRDISKNWEQNIFSLPENDISKYLFHVNEVFLQVKLNYSQFCWGPPRRT